MALPLTVDDINAVPEAFRGEYAEKDGKFTLSVTGLETIYVPRDALTKANREAAERRHALNGWETIANGRAPEEIGSILADFDSGKLSKGKSKEEFDALLTQHKKASDTTIATLTSERDTAYGVARKAVVDGGLKGALANAKATKEGLALLPKILGDRIELKFENGEPVQRILAADGKSPMIGTGSDGYATMDDLIKDVTKAFPSLFEGSGAGGGGVPHKNGGNGGNKTITSAEFNALSAKDRAAKMADGYTIAG